MTSSSGGEVTEVLQITDERVPVVIIHVGDDPLLCGCVLCCGVCHIAWLLSRFDLDRELKPSEIWKLKSE